MRIPKLGTTLLLSALFFSQSLASFWVLAEVEEPAVRTAPPCEVSGLAVTPPSPWFSEPIDSQEEGVEGCQMVWEEDDQYMGIIRLMSFRASRLSHETASWEELVIAVEILVMEEMGVVVGDPIWSRDSVPITGAGFRNAKAIGFDARLTYSGAQQNEVHFLLFESATQKYVISAVTPSKATSPDIYSANTSAMATIMRTLEPR